MGHSLLGIAIACVPIGLVLTWVTRRIVPQRWLARLGDDGGARPLGRAIASLAIGALSHVVFDLVTHCNFPLLWPFWQGEVFPAWWCRPWAGIPLLVYRKPYPLAPHTIVWCIVTVVGIWSFFRCLLPRATSLRDDRGG
jgi:hypothetical protein